MRRGSLVMLPVVGLALLTTSCAGAPDRQVDHSGTAVGLTSFTSSEPVTVPSLAGTTLTGRTVSSSSYAAGSPLVINVWASWCAPCRQELPLLARAVRHGIRVLGIDEHDSAGRAASFAREHGVTYPSLQDPDGRLLASLRLLPRTGIPSTLFVTASGTARARVVGPLDPGTLRKALRMAAS
jgi:thiol-disulfide isomerase/thioredoxin